MRKQGIAQPSKYPRHTDKLVETFELSDDQCPMCPRASERDDEVISPSFRRELAILVDGVSERADLALELAA